MPPRLATARDRRPAEVDRSDWGLPGAAVVANNTPTATKLSQKPACISAQGSMATTTAPASNHTWGQGHCRPDLRRQATVANINKVLCAGTPQPLNKA